MFNTGGTAVLLDGDGLANVTLDFVCLRCHTTEDLTWASGYAMDIHTNGINDVEGDENVPTEFVLSQNYPIHSTQVPQLTSHFQKPRK